MKIRNWLFIAPILLGLNISQAQEKKLLTINEAVGLALNNSNVSALASAKVSSSKQELQGAKNNQYPSFKVSAQYLRLTHVSMSSSLGGSSSGPLPSPDALALAQATLALPVFNGFTLKNTVKASAKKYEAEGFAAKYTKEQLAIQVIDLFSSLYKAEQTEVIIEGSLKSAEQRVADFTAMEANGLIARNDLMKAQLQASRIKLTLEESKKNKSVANFELVTLLKLPEGTQVDIDVESIKADIAKSMEKSTEGVRYDLESAMSRQQAAETGIKIAKGGYYPSLSLLGGYIGLNIKDVLAVNYAMNYGLGFSYDIASIFKNKTQVRLAKSRNEEAKQQVAILNDQIKEEAQRSQENYQLAIKQSAVYDEAVAQATENYRIVKDKFDNSLATTNDLIEADTDQLLVKVDSALSKVDIAQKYYELQFAQGKLVNSLNITSN